MHRDTVPAHVAAFDVALQPAVTAYASPLKMMEYLVLGKAIVAPRALNICEILSDGENAVLFGEAERGSLEAALTQICKDEALRCHLGAAARETIDQQQLTWVGNARKVVALAEKSMENLKKERKQ